MANRNLQWINVITGTGAREVSPGEEAFLEDTTEIEQRPAHDPRLAPRDEMIFLLHTAAEVEHALMAQYLFASWSVPADTPVHSRWRSDIMMIAQQEMGHLATVQNILRAIGGPINFEREDYPFNSDFYPFHFRLQPLSVLSLAKYVIAEMPENANILPAEMAKIMERARAGNDQSSLNRVGLLYKQILDLLDKLSDGDFMAHSTPFEAPGVDWGAQFDPARPLNDQIVVAPVTSKAEAREALCQIAVQGEGMTACSGGAVAGSHFERFLTIYRERDAEGTDEPVAPIAPNPNTMAGPSGDPALDAGRITNKTARLWAQLFNIRYRMLLADLSHYFCRAGDTPSPGQQPRGFLRDRAFGEMSNLSGVSAALTGMSQLAGGNGAPPFAGPPFEMPYTISLPDQEIDRWRLHRDLISASGFLSDKILAGPGDVSGILAGLKSADAQALQFINEQAGSPPQPAVPVLKELRILPPIAIARFGSSQQPLDNYTVEVDQQNFTGFRKIVPAETLKVDDATGEISGVSTPASITFRDNSGLIKPVAPFFEVWARFDDNDFLEPLTTDRLAEMGSSADAVNWRVRVGNHKVFRRTGDQNDKVSADSGSINDHGVHVLRGRANNFKAGKTIKLCSFRYLKPTAAFPEIRLRFTPAEGKVYGHRAGDPNITDDVYNAAVGRWDNHNDGSPNLPAGTPLSTSPQGIYAVGRTSGPQQGRNLGYLDDSCDGVVEVQLTAGNVSFSASARVAVAPPDFAPDSFHVRTVADEIEQLFLGPKAEETISFERATDLMRRALETMRLMNTDDWNRNYLDDDVAFPPETARYASVRDRHETILNMLKGLKSGASESARQAALGALSLIVSMLRRYDRVTQRTAAESQLMPALMRGADAFHLAVNRRQLSIIEKAARDFAVVPSQPPAGTSPEAANMMRIISELSFHSNRHTAFDAGGGKRLSELFSDPPALLQYLRTATARGTSAGPLSGQPLVVPGNAEASAFVKLLQQAGHPMQTSFQQIDGPTQKKRIDVVRDWINSL
jgi:hypothetical protein